jgi:hypothetical protein
VLHFLYLCIWLLANHEAIQILRKMLTLGVGKVPKHWCHNSYNKPINLTLIKTNRKRCDSVWRHLPAAWLQKQCHPPVIPTIDCTPADLECWTVWDNQPTKTKLGSTCSVWNTQQ